jgi:hypothetical protein
MLTTLVVEFVQPCRRSWRGGECVKRNIRAEFISGRPPNPSVASGP